MNGVSYPYAHGDLLENRNQYSYSRYYGQPFLDVWLSRRKELMQDIVDKPEKKTNHFRDETSFTQQAKALQTSLQADEQAAFKTLDLLLQRWEITKRIYSAYQEDGRPVDKHDYQRPDHYLIFAELLETAYHRTNRLPYFNGLLKIMDTLTCLRQHLDSVPRQHKLDS